MSKRAAQPKPGEPIRVVTTKGGETRYRVTLDTSRKGEPRKQRTTTHDTLTDARRHVEQVRADLSRGTYAAPVRGTFKALSTEYLARVERGDHGRKAVRPRTLVGYREALRRIEPLIGSRPVADLRYEDVAAAVDTLAGRYSARSVALTLTLVRAVLTHGVRHHGLPRNVAEGIAPQGKAAAKREAYTPEQLRALSRAGEGDRLGGVWAVILLGLRRSEALGLRWSDVDLAGGVLTVARSRVWAAGGFTDNAPKTDRGARRVALDPVTVERLKSMRKAHAVERLAVGVGLTDDDVLAAHEDGTPMRPEYLAREWRALCGRAEVPALGFHAARHGQVKTLRAAGLPDGVIAARLGHNETVMRDTYGVPHDSEQQAAAAVMARLLG